MEIHSGKLSDIVRYLEDHQDVKLEEKKPEFESILKMLKAFKHIDQDTKVLEIGVGTGWFPILCKKEGISCRGLEISQHLVEYAHKFGQKYGIKPDIEIGNIEETDIGISEYDVIIASSVFEHVEHWQKGLERVFKALKPGGLFYFDSTNKFSFRSGEYNFPLYGWLPNSWRYRLRKTLQGEDIMKLGIDFNQFTYFQLRRFFKNLGFAKIFDRVEILDPNNLNNPTTQKKMILKILKGSKVLKNMFLSFSSGTLFICIK
jgi:2-polyprenyl-3-methyl-5-hydroxy-6-metoxy-1,4-benzoquinol methylase